MGNKTSPESFDRYVIANILTNNKLKIKEVNNLQSLKSIYFIDTQYPLIEAFMEAGDIESIKAFAEDQNNTGEYMEVMLFQDQNKKQYIVSVYDTNQLEQDPQIINIFPL